MKIQAVKFRKDGFYYICSICGYVFEPAEHDGVAFENLPEDWKCPRCKQSKDKFNKTQINRA